MTVPEIVQERVADEGITARVRLGGDDELVVTPSRTLVYRAEGLLSGESVEEHPHEAERLAVSDGRRKSTISLDHGLDGRTEITVPKDRLDDALVPVFSGVLRAAGVTQQDEDVQQVYRLGELTIAITDDRVIKHIGGAVWDDEYEEYAFEDVTRLEVEEGDVSSQILIEVNGRPQRIKTPSEDARQVREHIEQALLDHHEAATYDEFLRSVAPEDEDESAGADTGADEDGPDRARPGTADDRPDAGSSDIGLIFDDPDTLDAEPAADRSDATDDVAEQLAALREVVERQNELLADQRDTIEQLIEELKRGR